MPRELSNSKVWDLFTCKNVCDSCKSLPKDSKCDCCRKDYQTTQIPLDLIEHFVKRLGLGDSFNAVHLSLSW